MPKAEFDDLAAFVTVAREQSFTKAAAVAHHLIWELSPLDLGTVEKAKRAI